MLDKNEYNVIDLFAGCGGLTEGFEAVGLFNTIACVEWRKYPVLNLINRLMNKWGYEDAERRVLRFDIRESDKIFDGWSEHPEYGDHIGLDNLVEEIGEVDIITGGPPCQAYSVAGRNKSENEMHKDYRNYLFESYLELVDRYKPKIFVFENVVGMLSSEPGGDKVTDLIRNGFDNIGYEIISNIREHAVLDFSEFGVPQNRRRVIILGISRKYFKDDFQNKILNFYKEILPKYKENKKKTVGDTLLDLPKFFPADEAYRENGKRYSHYPYMSEVDNHEPRYHNKRDIQIFHDLAYDIYSGEEKYQSKEALRKLYKERTGKESNVYKYHVLREDEPSNTIPAHLRKDGLRHIHPDPEQARSITVREAARLQTFADDYEFLGSRTSQYRMIGNAVPPLFSEKLALAVNDFLNKYK